ncbi:fimbrial protein [Paraburkholderia sp.]|uniref:fimbrial protein n=1 Tax=Paraburkholderia sp. TaxID=1926495 RepID=UPI0025D854D0|nr:fimbrial protein [Paraburkholderia sp.]
MLIDHSNKADPARVKMKTGPETMYARRTTWAATLVLLAMVLVPGSVLAQSKKTGCWKIETKTESKDSEKYTQPGLTYGPWTGAVESAGKEAYPMTIQITSFSNEGALLGSTVSSLHDLGAGGNRDPYRSEQVLFRCSPEAAYAMYEYYSTNGSSGTAGSWDASQQSGIAGTYRFPQKDVVSRVTNLDTGEVVTRNWKMRALSGVDRDEQDWFLVKVKNFSRYKVDLFQCKRCGSTDDDAKQPIAYVAFKGGSSAHDSQISAGLSNGADHSSSYAGRPNEWPGAINPKLDLKTRINTVTCAVHNTTPTIRFPPMSVAELNSYHGVTMPITIDIQCEKNFVKNDSGTAAFKTAMGIMAREENAASAKPLALVTGGDAVTYLLSDGYGKKLNVAKGVGVKLTRPDKSDMYFLTKRYLTERGAVDGWYPVLQDATQTGSDTNWHYYTRTVNATFEAFKPKQYKVTPGKYNATAEVVISIQ